MVQLSLSLLLSSSIIRFDFTLFMPILEYKCDDCSSVFECFFSLSDGFSLKCVSCNSSRVQRVKSMIFTPNKNFCPKANRFQKGKNIKESLSDLFGMNEKQCYSWDVKK